MKLTAEVKGWLLAVPFVLVVVTLVLGVAAGLSACGAWVFQHLWNFAAVDVFGVPELSFLHAWGLWVLVAMCAGLLRATVTVTRDRNAG